MQFPSPVPHSNNKSSTEGCHGSCSKNFLSGIAVTTSFVWVPQSVSMLPATGTDARGNPCSVDAGETVLLHTPSPRRPTEPLEVGYRCWQISCTPARGHGN
ncbi:hypothetical protein TcCL_ESM07913 [Trypanosoma cruzi]|nr:hypothetical protein TcCL_Unassigned02713 [Trypanosoma cruzi]RNC54645.1 hypothetical protein TcCL_ESM07913 [Trypanosoma cruzi]